MKKTLLLLATFCALSVVALNAQNGQNKRWFVGGTIGVHYTNTDFKENVADVNLLSVSIAPSIHRMVGENWAIGLQFAYHHTNYRDHDVKLSRYQFLPTLNYFCHLGSNFYYTPQFQLLAGFGKDDYGIVYYDVTNFGAELALLSFEYRPTHSLGINISAGDLSYVYTKFNPNNGMHEISRSSRKHNDFNFKFNSNFEFTFRYYF